MKYYLGLDLGGTNMVAGVIDENYHILSKKSAPTGAGRSIDEITAHMANLSKEAVSAVGLKLSDFTSWGIGMPSYVNPKTRLLVHANNFGWRNVPVLEYLQRHMDLPIYIDNDANCAAYGESLAGAAKSYCDALMLTLGTGVGGGVILNKRIFSGADGMGAELGHTKLVFDGVSCTCGKKGCLEAYCSATALIRQTREAICNHPRSLMAEMWGSGLAKIDGALAFSAAGQGDAAAEAVVDQYIAYLSAGISTFITIFRPEVIIIGGGISNEGDHLLVPLNQKIRENTFAAEEIGVPEVTRAALGNDAGLIGAAFLESGKSKTNSCRS